MFRKIDEVLAETVSQLGIDSKLAENRVFSLWEECVGQEIAEATQPVRLNKGILFVHTSTPSWSQQLTIIKKEIIDRLNPRLTVALRDIRFQPKGLQNHDDFNNIE